MRKCVKAEKMIITQSKVFIKSALAALDHTPSECLIPHKRSASPTVEQCMKWLKINGPPVDCHHIVKCLVFRVCIPLKNDYGRVCPSGSPQNCLHCFRRYRIIIIQEKQIFTFSCVNAGISCRSDGLLRHSHQRKVF